MHIKIFDVKDGNIIVNEECLTIPELKAVIDVYEDPIPPLSYLYYMYDPTSSYHNLPEEEKETTIMEDYQGEYTTEDETIINAATKLKKLYTTPTMQFYLDMKELLFKLGAYGKTTAISSGKDGNYSAMQSQIKAVGTTIKEFKFLEETVQKELEDRNMTSRGNKKLAYDEEI